MARDVKTEVYTSYVPGDDITIIWQDLSVDGECVQHALIGWYCGEPDPSATKNYSNMPLIGQYID